MGSLGTNAGVGYSENPDSAAAGLEAASAAMARLAGAAPAVVLLFATSKHDQEQLLRSVRAVVGPNAKIVGGGAAGAITNDRLGSGGCQVGIAVLASDTMRARTFIQPGLAESEHEVGRALGEQVRRHTTAGGQSPLLLMYESVKRATPDGPMLNMGSPLLEGLAASLGTIPPVVGLGLHGDLRWMPGKQFFDDRLESQSAIAVSLGAVTMTTTVISNLRPMSTYREITAAEGPAVLGIDGRPALEVIEDLVGPDLRWEDYPLTVTLGVNSGDKFGEFREEEYANYLCVAVDRERRALLMSDTYLRPGTMVQLMRRQMDFADIRRRAAALLAGVRDTTPFLALYIDCAGRAASWVGTDREEAAEIQAVVGPDLPLLGLYSGSEIARVGEHVRRLNHAGVFTILSE